MLKETVEPLPIVQKTSSGGPGSWSYQLKRAPTSQSHYPSTRSIRPYDEHTNDNDAPMEPCSAFGDQSQPSCVVGEVGVQVTCPGSSALLSPPRPTHGTETETGPGPGPGPQGKLVDMVAIRWPKIEDDQRMVLVYEAIVRQRAQFIPRLKVCRKETDRLKQMRHRLFRQSRVLAKQMLSDMHFTEASPTRGWRVSPTNSEVRRRRFVPSCSTA